MEPIESIRPKRKRFQKLKGVQPPSSEEVAYRNKLMELTKAVEQMVAEEIIPLFNSKVLDGKAVDASEDDLLGIFTDKIKNIRDNFASYVEEFKTMASEFGFGLESVTKKRFDNVLKGSFGAQTDMYEIMANEGLSGIVNSGTQENVALIKSIPENYLNKVESLVKDNFVYGSKSPGGLQSDILSRLRADIRAVGPKAKKRAKLIARDQTSKLTAVLTKKRQTNLGIEEYVWRDSRDRRVRGNPAGTNPNVPKSRDHWARNGKVFRWDSPPPDGHPGEPINCRCIAEPVIKKLGVQTKQIEESVESDYNKKEQDLLDKLASGEIKVKEFNERMRRL